MSPVAHSSVSYMFWPSFVDWCFNFIFRSLVIISDLLYSLPPRLLGFWLGLWWCCPQDHRVLSCATFCKWGKAVSFAGGELAGAGPESPPAYKWGSERPGSAGNVKESAPLHWNGGGVCSLDVCLASPFWVIWPERQVLLICFWWF